MPSLKFFMFFLVQLYLVSFHIGVTSATDPTYLYQDCPNATTFSRNSAYQCNLKFFHSSLVSNVTRSNGFSNGFYNATAGQDPNKAWKHWRDGTPLQLLDSTLTESYSRNKVIKCIHMGLLCVQEDPTDRPTMATIVIMLDSYSVTLPTAQQPAFFLASRTEASMAAKDFEFDQSKSKSMPWSVDDASIIEVYPR
ncbi:hypothetical protein Patl1_11007 [Pistacia atlantica]|uniref:Uncharacterized protein n=1 Tax=Pistacia atlantica TaxID=434234 RepID=A0ACC1A4T5_9ROSI|nr:hypothetical protein Patl1_11007 [Pistacia atlantica]